MLGPDYIEHFTDAAQGAMDEYALRLVCIYAALIGSIDFEGDSAYSQAARKAALAAKDVQKSVSNETVLVVVTYFDAAGVELASQSFSSAD